MITMHTLTNDMIDTLAKVGILTEDGATLAKEARKFRKDAAEFWNESGLRTAATITDAEIAELRVAGLLDEAADAMANHPLWAVYLGAREQAARDWNKRQAIRIEARLAQLRKVGAAVRA